MTAISVSTAEYGRPEGRLALTPLRVLQFALAVFVLGNVGRIPVLELGDRTAPLLVNDVALFAVLLIGGFAMAQARSIRLNDVALAAIVFATIGGLSTIAGIQRFGFSALEVMGSLAYLARWFVYFLLYVVIINCVRAADTEAVWVALERAMLVIVAFGIVQSIFMPNFAFIVYPDARPQYDFDQQRHRLVSTILEPNIISGMIVTILLVQLARLSTGVQVPLWKPVLMFAGLIATLSRSGMLAFLVGSGILLLIRGPSKKLIKLGAIVFVLILPGLPKLVHYAEANARLTITDNSALARIMMWSRALETFLDHPWFGIGFNTYGFVQERRGFERLGGAAYSVEGGLLFIAVMTGIVGLLVYMAMLWFVLRRSRSAWRSIDATREERGIVVGTAAATLAILVHTMFVNSLLTPWVMEPLWVLWGISFIICVEVRRRTSARASP